MNPVILVAVVAMTIIGIGAGIASHELRLLARDRPDLTNRLIEAVQDDRRVWEQGNLEPRLPTWLAPETTHGWLGETRNTGSTPILGPLTRL